MDAKMNAGVLAYFDTQIEAVRAHLRPALVDFDEAAVHQARVATRRLKAAFDVLAPLTGDLKAGGLNKAGRTLRRRLGPLRDSDVMIGHLAESGLPPRSADAVAWVAQHFDVERRDARVDSLLPEKKLGKLSAKFDDWWRVRHALGERLDAVGPVLTTALHARFDAFASLADRVSGVVEEPADAPPVDVHELRIDGKAVRYAFELAVAHGLPVPEKMAKSFKAMQDALGDWHDEVVLAERVLLAVVNADLPLHRPALAAMVLDVARAYVGRCEKSLDRFRSLWKKGGPGLRSALHAAVPLTIDAAPAAQTPVVIEPPPATMGDEADDEIENL